MSSTAVIVRLPRMVLVLEPQEILTLIRTNPDLYAKALKRGKHYARKEKSYNTVGSGRHAIYPD